MSTLTKPAPPASGRTSAPRGGRPARRKTSLSAHGEPMLWLTGGSLVIGLVMIAGLLALVAWQGLSTFWPVPLVRFETAGGGATMGEVRASERYDPINERAAADEAGLAAIERSADAEGQVRRRLVRTGNYDLTGQHFRWLSDFELASEDEPEWGLVVERLSWGRFYGFPAAFRVDGKVVAEDPARAPAERAFAAHELTRLGLVDAAARAAKALDVGGIAESADARTDRAALERRAREVDAQAPRIEALLTR